MVLKGVAKMVGFRSGKTRNNKDWFSVVLDATDDPLERVQYFLSDDSLVEKAKQIGSGNVYVEARIYPMKDGAFGSRLLDINAMKEGGK